MRIGCVDVHIHDVAVDVVVDCVSVVAGVVATLLLIKGFDIVFRINHQMTGIAINPCDIGCGIQCDVAVLVAVCHLANEIAINPQFFWVVIVFFFACVLTLFLFQR